MSEIEMSLLQYYRSLPNGEHTLQELLEWLWLESKAALELYEGKNDKS